jgi:methylmalonyl-CoA mutase
MNFFMEVAKLRAARLLWAKMSRSSAPRTPNHGLRTHSQTSGWSLTAQDVYNNVVRTCIEAMAATQGHTQSLHTNALDEALALPTDFSARIARNTQLFLQQETGTRVVDPWGGSTTSNADPRAGAPRLGAHPEVEELGGMAKAIEHRHPQDAHRGGRRAHAGAHRQRPADHYRRQQVSPGRRRGAVEVLKVDNTSVREQQVARLESCAPSATPAVAPLEALTKAAEQGEGNLLDLAVDAARAKATVGEISAALEKVYGRHQAEIRSIRGVYSGEMGERQSGPGTRRAPARARPSRPSPSTKAAVRAS